MTIFLFICITLEGVIDKLNKIDAFMGERIVMKIFKLKKKSTFSLITLMICCTLFYFTNSIFNITGLISTKAESVKEKEMKYMIGEIGSLSDNYSYENTAGYVFDNVNRHQDVAEMYGNNLKSNNYGEHQNYSLIKDTNEVTNEATSISDYINKYSEYQNISNELKKQVVEDSYRHKKLGVYYVFNYEYTMDVLKKLDKVIEKTAMAQKMPKALLTSVLFREMMFIGQEDLLDGVKIIGGKSMGICQIGVQNVRYNENAVHGKDSIISSKSDEEIMEMLQNPNQAVYFCAVQLRARAISLTDNSNVDLYNLDEKQIHKVLEEYNQSKIPKTIGPVKTKARYAEETYKYYRIISRLYDCEAN